jgi:hypothetical protein
VTTEKATGVNAVAVSPRAPSLLKKQEVGEEKRRSLRRGDKEREVSNKER